MPLPHGLDTLTDKEKATLRLIVRGHDAKSAARALDLSVHTINERLRDSRRKLAVSSSREAARLLLAAEGDTAVTPKSSADDEIGDAARSGPADVTGAPIGGAKGALRPRLIIGVILMTVTLGLLALFGLTSPITPVATPSRQAPANPAVVDAARQWLALIDRDDWAASYRGTGAAFRKLNTEAVWAAASEQVRARFGKMISRTFLSQEEVPAPPAGYQVVRFRTQYANKADAVETVTFEHDEGAWRVVGVTVE